MSITQELLARDRRTHSAHYTKDEARKAAYDLAYLMNGVPNGYVLAVQQRMGAYVLISYLV